jgi:hypothetical protein
MIPMSDLPLQLQELVVTHKERIYEIKEIEIATEGNIP